MAFESDPKNFLGAIKDFFGAGRKIYNNILFKIGLFLLRKGTLFNIDS